MLPFFVTVTLLCAQISAEANYLVPNAYYSGNSLGYSNTWYSYNGQPSYVYPQQVVYTRTSTSKHPYLSYYYPNILQYNQNYQYRSINSYQPPAQQFPFATQTKSVKNDPYAANPYVSLLKPATYNPQYAAVTTQNYVPVTATPYIPTETAKPYVAPVTAKPYVAPVTAKPYVPVTAKPYVAPVTAKPIKPVTAKPYVAPVTAKPFKALPAVPTKLVKGSKVNKVEEEETVLDFSGGEAREVENTATKVKKVDTIETTNGFEILTKGYEKLGLEQELAGIGNITIFAPRDEDFEKAGIDIDTLDRQILRQIILKHLVKGTLERKDLKGTVQTLAGVPITLTKNEKGKLIIVSNGQTTKLKITNVRTKWGIVHVIDSVLA